MTNQRRNIRQVLVTAAVALSASLVVAFTPSKASAFDIGGLIGAAMAAHMGHGGYSGGHTRSHAVRQDGDSSDHGSATVERDARDPVSATPPSGKSDNRVAGRQQKTQGPSSLSGGLAQASEPDATAGQPASQIASAGKSFDDAPAFNPSR